MESGAVLRIFSVWELTHYLRSLIQSDEILSRLGVRGEVSNHSVSEAGHCYFTLKDGKSQVSCVLFAGRAGRLNCRLRDGMQVVVEGRLEIYEKAGRYQIIVERLEPEGEGALYLSFLRLKERLGSEGLFDSSRKRPLPFLPRAVGIVTSPRGAVLHDMTTTLRKRLPCVSIILASSAVQGEDAPAQLIRGITRLNGTDEVDVIIVARGGGSFEELNAFNDEALARAIAASHVPVVSAVGHETDFTIADFVSDKRAPTPTGAAQMVVPDAKELIRRIEMLRHRIAGALKGRLNMLRDRVRRAAGAAVLRYPLRILERPRLQLDDLTRDLERYFRSRCEEARRRFALALTRLDALCPLAVLSRGYAILERLEDGAVITSSLKVRRGDGLRAVLHDGTIDTAVVSVSLKRE
jgi:exodeoxyribonuclease VII large subunit